MPPTTTAPSWSLPDWLHVQNLTISDPLVLRIVYAAGALIVLVILLRILRRVRDRARDARVRAELRREKEEFRLQQEELRKLAARIVATSSTGRIAGYALVRQVETVFTEPRASSVAAIELAKALAAQKGANAIINFQSQPAPTGKWIASGDGVVVKLIGRRDPPGP